MKCKSKKDFRKRRHFRIRKVVKGSAERPRMAVFRSQKHIAVQLIDDVAGHTLLHVSTLSGGLKGQGNTVEISRMVGAEAARQAVEKGIHQVVFDRAGFNYAGKVKALADAAREAGLKF